MTSILKVDTIQNVSTGTTAMTIDSTGRVLTAARPALVLEQITPKNGVKIIVIQFMILTTTHLSPYG